MARRAGSLEPRDPRPGRREEGDPARTATSAIGDSTLPPQRPRPLRVGRPRPSPGKMAPTRQLHVTSALNLAGRDPFGVGEWARRFDVTSGGPGGARGNMALNGAGEGLGCEGRWPRGLAGGSLGHDPSAPCASLPPEADACSWQPPTEAETKVLQARRERQDRISRLMGDYLLRGYRMLGETCEDCGVSLRACGVRGGGPGPRTLQGCTRRPPRLSPTSRLLPPRPSSCKTSNGKSTAWPVRSSTRTWIKTIRVRGRLEKKRGATEGQRVGGSGICIQP